jgi:anti-sigma-K factor RskA
MADLDHESLRDTAALYVVGALDRQERAAFEAHVRECASCAADVQALGAVAHALPHAAPQVDPPPALRNRVVAIAREGSLRVKMDAAENRRIRGVATSAAFIPSWLSVAALVLVSVALGVYAFALRERLAGLESQLTETVARLNRTQQELAAATQTTAGVQARLAVLTAPDLQQVTLAGQPPARQAAGRAFLSRSSGLLFAASNLPPLPAGRTYQLWYLTRSVPISAGVFRPDDAGRAAVTQPPPATTPAVTGLAVSIEPEGGVPAPTGAIYLAGQTQ